MEPPVRGAFSVLDGVDRCVASVPVYFRERVGGRLGVTLSGTDASSLLVLTVVLPLPEAQDASGVQRRTGLTITAADVEGFDLDDASVVVDALAAADAGTRLQVAVGSAALTVAESSDEHRFPHAVRLQAVVRALQRLSENCGRRLNFPRGMTDAQADMLVTAARLLDGVQVTVPARRWSLSLLPQCVKGMVAAITDDGQFLEIRPDAALVAGDMEIPYGPLVQWAPAVRLLNRAVLEAHNGIDPIKAEFEIIDGRHVCWLPRERAEELAQHNGT